MRSGADASESSSRRLNPDIFQSQASPTFDSWAEGMEVWQMKQRHQKEFLEQRVFCFIARVCGPSCAAKLLQGITSREANARLVPRWTQHDTGFGRIHGDPFGH